MVAWLGALIVEGWACEDIREGFSVGVDGVSLLGWEFPPSYGESDDDRSEFHVRWL